MNKKEVKKISPSKEKNAGTLAACGLMEFFHSKNWKIISFFPNAVEAGSEKKKIANSIKPNKKLKKPQI